MARLTHIILCQRQILYTQQILLSSAKLPGFVGPTVDFAVIAFQSKVCSVMHSAFYLRAKVGETLHANMLNKQLESLEKFIKTAVKVETPEQPSFPVPAFPPPPQPMQFPPPPNMGIPPPPMMMYPGQIQQPQMMGVSPYQQTMTMGMQQQMMQQQGQPGMPPQQYMGLNLQPGQQ